MGHPSTLAIAALLAMAPLSQALAWGNMGSMVMPSAPMNPPAAASAAPAAPVTAAPIYVPPPVVAPTAVTMPIVNMPNPADTATRSVDPTPVATNLDNADLPPPPPGGWGPIRDTIYNTAANRQPLDVFTTRVPNGQSCVNASEDRATAIYNALQPLNDNGTLGNYQVEVGTMSGYQIIPGSGNVIPGGTSAHTFTVVTFTERNTGKQVAYEVDNYFMPTYVSPTSAPVADDPQYAPTKVTPQAGGAKK